MAEWMSRIFLIYLTTIIACTLWKPEVIFNNGDVYTASALAMFNIHSFDPNATVGSPTPSGFPNNLELSTSGNNAFGGMTTIGSEGGILSGFGVIDILRGAIGWIKIFFSILFSPVVLLTSGAFAGMPLTIVLFFGIPLGAMFLFGMILFIRGVGG